ncbi:DUF3104 domain-containing protein [bacterium]|nr:DUF3104 domain-containing protein [bacterium]
MSTDHPTSAPSPLANTPAPAFLSVRPGNLVIVQAQQQVAQKSTDEWFMGQVIWCEGGARDPRVNTMFQVANVDNGEITWVNGDAVTHVLP